jgi:hypothetical protein
MAADSDFFCNSVLAGKAISEKLLASLIILIGLGAFVVLSVVADVVLRMWARLSPADRVSSSVGAGGMVREAEQHAAEDSGVAR